MAWKGGTAAAAGRSWRLLSPYFTRSEERRSARALLAFVLVLSILQTEIGVLTTYWSNLLYDSFEQKDEAAFFALVFTWEPVAGGWIMPGFLMLALLQVALGSTRLFATQSLQIRWRSWMTGTFLRDWTANSVFYRMGFAGGVVTDNPDQRLSDDIAALCGAGANAIPEADTLTLFLGLVSNLVSLVSYVVVLWVLSRGIVLFGVRVPGLMVWVALLFSAGSTLLAWLVGRQLISLRFMQQRHEADFRFGLARLRENAAGVALLGGAAEERRGLLFIFAAVRANFIAMLRRVLLLNIASDSYGQVVTIFPQLLIAPQFFAGRVMLGTMIQTGQAFGEVQGALSWFADRFTDLARWRATAVRVEGFAAASDAVSGEVALAGSRAAGFSLRDVAVWLPDGTQLAEGLSLDFTPGVDVSISGASGVGKSTLFKVFCGVWPFCSGDIVRPDARVLFMPQNAYLPLGNLRRAVCYPLDAASVAAGVAERALEDVGLAYLVVMLDAADDFWGHRLSGGEQRRLAVARAIVVAPDWLFLDEATAGLDADAALSMYAVLRQRLPGTTIVSIVHDAALAALHSRHLVLSGVPWIFEG